jgi:hypothetical protein
VPNAAMTIKVRNKVIIIATTLFIRNLIKKLTTGWRTMAIMMAKRTGTIMPLAIYIKASKARMPMKNIMAFT